MFEGLVRQLLLGYLGRYIKDFQKEQLKITLWNEKVYLEDVELILEAFDHLQLPVALKRGHVGRLSIRIPWKKLGWDPIIIELEDVLFCAGPRDDHEWSADAVERREWAAKKAKLAAAELTKLSRRVCDNQAGQSLISHVTGRILDSIQISMRNVHISYFEMQSQLMLFGLRFSRLEISKQTPVGPLSLKARDAQVNKNVEIHGLGIYCSDLDGSLGFMGANDAGENKLWQDAVTDDKFDYIVEPFDLTLQVTKSGKLEIDAPQYTVIAELTKLVMTINPAQLGHILKFSDYINTCQLREKYGRYRPWDFPLSKKFKGWQKIWWQYAKDSVLSDVRKKLKKISWSYFWQRLDHRRKYVNLYKDKLNFLQRGQPVDKEKLCELEQMEKDFDIEDILWFRSIAEQELEDTLRSVSYEAVEGCTPAEKLPNDDALTSRARGWLNWLSRGVLGAGGTDDSSQFSGVVSDEVLKDICEATKFQPMPSVNIGSDGLTFLFAAKFHITKMSLLLKSVNLAQEIAEFSCSAIGLEFTVRKETTAITVKVGSAEVTNSSKQLAVLQIKQAIPEEDVLSSGNPSASIEVTISTKNQMEELMFRVMMQLVLIDCDLEFLLHVMEFYNVLDSHMSLKKRVLLSLNGIRDVGCRLQSKAECVLSGRQKVIWDVNLAKLTISLPWKNEKLGTCSMIVETYGLLISSKSNIPPFASKGKDQSETMSNHLTLEAGNDILHTLQLNGVFDHYEVSMDDFQVTLFTSHLPQGLPVVDKFSASVSLAHCIIPNEMFLKQLEVHFIVSSLHVHFSADIHAAFLSLFDHIHLLSSNHKQVQEPKYHSLIMASSDLPLPFCFAITAIFELFKLKVILEDDSKGERKNAYIFILSLQLLNLKFIRGEDQDLWVSMRDVKATSYQETDDFNSDIICSSRNFDNEDVSPPQQVRSKDGGNYEWNESLDGCFYLHYIAHKTANIHHTFTIYLSDIEFHCYPYIVRLLVKFCEELMMYDSSGVVENSFHQTEFKPSKIPTFNFQRFGVSNFCENGFVDWASIPLDRFPFVAIHNFGLLRSLDSSIFIPEWTSFKLREKNIENPYITRNLRVPLVKLQEADGDSIKSSSLDMQLDITNVRIHFHDSSCILGSITLPVGKASVICHADQFDVLSSVEGLTLFSDWWTCNFQEFLWGPSLPNRLPVLNIRLRKGSSYHTKSNLEISFGIQHVCCVIPPDYLAILIGYFSLADWRPNDSDTEEPRHIDSECHAFVVYNFEILDSIILSPVQSNKNELLKLHLPQFYGSFVVDDPLDNASFANLSEFLILEDKVADRADSLNIFGRDLHLHLLTVTDFGSETSRSDRKNGYKSCALVQSVSFDFWLRLPDESQFSATGSPSPICISTKVAHCEFAVEDSNFIYGFQALEKVIDQYALVAKKSKYFKHDVPGFLQLTQSLNNNSIRIPEESAMAVTEMRCCVNSMSVNLIKVERDSNSRDVIARMEMGFILTATLKNDMISCLNIQFSTLLLSASLNSIYLAKCLSDSTCASVVDIKFSAIQQKEIELYIDIPSVELWFHLSDWAKVIDHVYYCIVCCPQGSALDSSCSTAGMEDLLTKKALQSLPLSTSKPEKMAQDSAVAVVVKSNNIGLSCHIPFWVSAEAFSPSEVFDSHALDAEDFDAISGEKDTKFLTVVLQSRSSELRFDGHNLKLKTHIEKATGSVGIFESGSVQSWPFFQLLQVGAQIQICEYQKPSMGVNVEISCEGLDVWLSQQVLYFWHGIVIGTTEGDNSKIAFGTVDLKLQLNKASLLLTDGRWSCNGPLIELLMRNLHTNTILVENTTKFSTEGDLLVNYNNIHKVLWEPFLEPWSFEVNMFRNHDTNALLDNGIVTDIQLKSSTQLNMNITTSLCEVVLRAIEMVMEARSLTQIYEAPECQSFQSLQRVENLCVRRYASFTILNMTSLPFTFYVYQGLGDAENIDISAPMYENAVPPGASIPIYIDGTLEEQAFSHRPASSSEGLGKKLSNKAGHYFMTIQFEGTSQRSEPISMDLVGLTYFEVNFSNDKRADTNTGLLVPVVFDVSLQRYSKLIQLYSTVIFKNSTSMPLELRFDIPFGMSSKIIDPIYPGKEFPLPLHLAEAGHMRWRPHGNNYLWSEVYNLSMILSTETRSGFLRSLACNPSHPSSYLFRCCLSIEDISLSLSGRLGKRSPCRDFSVKQPVTNSGQIHNLKRSKSRFIHHVTLSTPFIVKSYLPQAISIAIEGGGATHTVVVREVESSFFHVDPSHDLVVKFNIAGYGPAAIKFPRAETFSATAKPSGTVLSLTETMAFYADSSDGSIYVTAQKIMNALSGARELCISVPFLLYNCTGFRLTVSRSDHELKGKYCNVPTCYDSAEQGLFTDQKDGLHLLPSENKPHPRALHFGNQNYISKNHIISSKEIVSPPSGIFLSQSLVSHRSIYCHQSVNQLDASNQPEITVSSFSNKECLKAMPVMYSPDPSAAAGDIVVRLSRCHSEFPVENLPRSSWSSPFFLVAPSGPTAVLVPQPSNNSAAVISVTSHLLDTPLMGQTRAVIFQPRYVISNACSKPLCYKQKGTDYVFHLGVAQHSHLHWIDTTRDFLIVVCFDEPGWQWSGSFLPDHLGDTQVKMRNHISGALNIIRIEVQNADAIQDGKIIGDAIGKSGTNFILLSDDDTGFVPYRIDNFSKETLRIYQQKCETLETIVHPYTSCPYAWDEPFYPHRLIVEIPGKRTLGPYTLDDVKEYPPVHVASSTISLEKHERTLLSSVHAEGAMKVLSIIDSSCHVLNEVKGPSSFLSGKRQEGEEDMVQFLDYKEKISVKISFIGISLIDSYPQELLYASAKDIRVEFLQNLERQSFSIEISSLQIDNQLRGTPYPVVLSFEDDFKGSLVSHLRNKDGLTKTKIESMMTYAASISSEPKICFVASKWRNKEMMFVSFEYISLRVGDLCLELDLELLLKLLEFFKAIRLLNSDAPTSVTENNDVCKLGVADRCFSFAPQNSKYLWTNGDHQFPKAENSSSDCHSSSSLPEVVPIGAPWQKIFLLARRQNKIYVEAFSLAPIKMTLSFSSNPWMLKMAGLSSGESLIHRSVVALADIEGAQICLRELTITHHMASWESIQEILLKHYSKEFLHEMYKVFGSAGVIGNPMGFARRVGLGVKDFLSVPAKGLLQSPSSLISGVAHGTSSLINNTLYAVSDTATQFSKAAHKGILAFTFDNQEPLRQEEQRIFPSSQSKGVINELLEGLTGLLQSPIKGAEKHGLPGVLSGFAFGVTGLVAKPAASVLEATGRTAQSIRNRSRLHRTGLHHLRARLPRSLSAELPLRPYSWEEAIGTTVLLEVEDSKFRDEVLVMCKSLQVSGRYVVLTENLILIIECSSLVDLGNSEFQGIVAKPEWKLIVEISLESVIHADVDEGVVHIVGSSSNTLIRQKQHRHRSTGGIMKQLNKPSTPLPLFQTDLELASKEEAEFFLRVLLSTIEQGSEQGWGNVYLLQQSNLRK